MSELCGWTGKILRVDLSSGDVSTLDTRDYVPAFVGGVGVGREERRRHKPKGHKFEESFHSGEFL